MYLVVWGDQTGQAYSKRGQTSDLYSDSKVAGSQYV